MLCHCRPLTVPPRNEEQEIFSPPAGYQRALEATSSKVDNMERQCKTT
jgi:hypothetical protein